MTVLRNHMAAYHRGRFGQIARNRTTEGLAAWFLGFAESASADHEPPPCLPEVRRG